MQEATMTRRFIAGRTGELAADRDWGGIGATPVRGLTALFPRTGTISGWFLGA